MPVYMVGSGGAQTPFNRTFFNVTLGEIVQGTAKEKTHKLLLFLADSTTFDVCSIDDLADEYLVVRAYKEQEQSCDLSINLIPYSLIYRIELTPKSSDNSTRLGFRWEPPVKRSTSVRKSSR
jgi:hypothetical protein